MRRVGVHAATLHATRYTLHVATLARGLASSRDGDAERLGHCRHRVMRGRSRDQGARPEIDRVAAGEVEDEPGWGRTAPAGRCSGAVVAERELVRMTRANHSWNYFDSIINDLLAPLQGRATAPIPAEESTMPFEHPLRHISLRVGE